MLHKVTVISAEARLGFESVLTSRLLNTCIVVLLLLFFVTEKNAKNNTAVMLFMDSSELFIRDNIWAFLSIYSNYLAGKP